MTRPFCFGLLLLVAPMHAQTSPAQRVPAVIIPGGSVSGSVTCADTNLPARLATVALEPVAPLPPAEPPQRPKRTPDAEPPLVLVRTHMTGIDGRFQIANIAPGDYYVVVEQPGYLSPALEFKPDDVRHPTPALRAQLAAAIPIVTVTPGRTASLEVRLTRAASIDATLRFDDGSPASRLYLTLEQHTKDDKWLRTNFGRTGGMSNDLGHLRVSGIPAGEYRIFTSLQLDDRAASDVFGGSISSSTSTRYELIVYAGDTFLRKDAKPVKIDDGQNITLDLTIPVSKLHALSGSLVEQGTGHVINAGTITVSTDDQQTIATAKVDASPSQSAQPEFRFDFLPEGTYTIAVTDARDVTRVPQPIPPGYIMIQQYTETTLRSFGPVITPLIVQSDQTGYVLTVPARATKP